MSQEDLCKQERDFLKVRVVQARLKNEISRLEFSSRGSRGRQFVVSGDDDGDYFSDDESDDYNTDDEFVDYTEPWDWGVL